MNEIKGKIMNQVIITVPHSVCNTDSHIRHTCDFVALDAAETMYFKFPDLKPIMLVADVNRDITDYNRKSSRSSRFRTALRDLLTNQPFCVLDVHSFPPEYPGEFDDAEVAIGSNNYKLEPYIKDVTKYLADNGIRAYAVGNIIADIVQEVKDYGVPGLLFEFNEGLETEYRRYIAESIVDFVLVEMWA